MTAAESIADVLAERKIGHVFGIIGAGNVHLFDAITRRGYTQIVAVHHEQAAVMAANAYFRVSEQVTCALVTTGAGASNALTGVLSAFMDSIPLVVIAGQEPSTREHVGRARGVQGWEGLPAATEMTKWAYRFSTAHVRQTLDLAFSYARSDRPGPVWLELSSDLQAQAAGELAPA